MYTYFTPSATYSFSAEESPARDAYERTDGLPKVATKFRQKIFSDIAGRIAGGGLPVILDWHAKCIRDGKNKEDCDRVKWYLIGRLKGNDYVRCLAQYNDGALCDEAAKIGLPPEMLVTQRQRDKAAQDLLTSLQQEGRQQFSPAPIVRGAAVFLFIAMLVGALVMFFKRR